MAFIKNDVTDEELDKLFNENDSSSFKKKEKGSDDSNVDNETLLSSELDVKNTGKVTIERPEEYKVDEVRDEKLRLKKEEESLIKSASEKIVNVTGQVTARIFSEIAKLRQNAYLEEYKKAQAKIPQIQPTAKIKLRGSEPECKYHVYRPHQMIDNDHMMTCCKYCSESKIFTMQEWMKYQLENKQYM